MSITLKGRFGNSHEGADGIARALHVTASGKRVVVVRVFVKKNTAPGNRVGPEKGEGSE